MSYLTFTNELWQSWSYFTEFHEISHVSELQSNESGEFAILHKIDGNGNVPWDIGKIGPDQSSAPKTFSFGEKIAKIGPADPDIICLWEIIKKDNKKEKEKRKKLTQAKYIARSAT